MLYAVLIMLVSAVVASDPFYTHFHVQALAHSTADPDGPAFVNSSVDPAGTYHLFAQYNPSTPRGQLGAYSHMQWYHWTSRDMLRWEHQQVALAPGAPQDCGGIWSGSITLVWNDTTGQATPVIMYSVPCQKAINYAIPANINDTNLTKWRKAGTLVSRPDVVTHSARALMADPVPAWQGVDGIWRLLSACNPIRVCMWKGKTLETLRFVGPLITDPPSNDTLISSFECPDFYPLPNTGLWVLSTMAHGWALGKYTAVADPTKPDIFTPIAGRNIPQLNQLFDYGSAGASAQRSFYDAKHDRRVLWGSSWSGVCPGSRVSGMMSFPRQVMLDPDDHSRIVTYPLSELETLWQDRTVSSDLRLAAGKTRRLPTGGMQLDIQVDFNASFVHQNTFGLRVLASADESKLDGVNASITTLPSNATTVAADVNHHYARLHGGAVRSDSGFNPTQADFLVNGDTIELRVLVDHSIVEFFAEGGKVAATAGICARSPSEDVGVDIFNEGPDELVLTITMRTVTSVNRLPTESTTSKLLV